MRLGILSRNRSLHSVRRLLQEAARMGVRLDTINPLECQLFIDGKRTRIEVGQTVLPHFDGILPRIGASITDYGLAVVKQFEALGSFTVNSSRAIAESRDKIRSLQILTEAGLQVPPSVLARTQRAVRNAVQLAGGMPVILKVPEGTQGVGVMLVDSPESLVSVLDTLWGLEQDVLIQKFLREGAGTDYRAFVIGKRVVAAMMRKAPEGEFRSNIHRGGEGTLVKLPARHARAAIRAAEILGLEIAGVDLMDSESGPMILEVNSSPGFEGIEKATGLNIAREIVQHMVKLTRQSMRKRPRRRAKPKR